MKHVLENNRMIIEVESDLIASKVKDIIEDAKKLFEGANEYTEVVLDISNSKIIDSLGITFIIGIYKSALKCGKAFKLSGVNNEIKQLFSIMKLDEIFQS